MVIHYMTEMEHPMEKGKISQQWYAEYVPL